MTAKILCRVILESGQPCGYQPEGKNTKAKIADLFRHEQSAHLEAARQSQAEFTKAQANLTAERGARVFNVSLDGLREAVPEVPQEDEDDGLHWSYPWPDKDAK